jgi:glyoxylase-like metal-dependent hydrolase (beta-lactamase superfamily II)
MKIALALALAFAATLHAPPASACEMMNYRRVQASPHVHVFEAAEGTTAVVNGNIVAVVGSDSVLVVDTGQIPSIARRVAAEIKSLTRAPVRYVVNSHRHGDHLLGNATFREAFPGVKFIAHSHTIEQAAKFYGDYAATMKKRLPAIVEDMRKQRAASKSDDEKLWIGRTLECVDALLPEVEHTHYLAPDVTVDKEMTLDLGGVTAVVKHIGAGNTPGDLVVWVEPDRLVAAGDMVVAPVPYAIGSAIEPWTRTMAALRALGAAVIVPGHGPVMRDDRYVRDVEALLATTRTQFAAMHARGVARAAAASQLDTGAFRELYLTTPMRRQAFDQFFVKAAIAQIWPKP